MENMVGSKFLAPNEKEALLGQKSIFTFSDTSTGLSRKTEGIASAFLCKTQISDPPALQCVASAAPHPDQRKIF